MVNNVPRFRLLQCQVVCIECKVVFCTEYTPLSVTIYDQDFFVYCLQLSGTDDGHSILIQSRSQKNVS